MKRVTVVQSLVMIVSVVCISSCGGPLFDVRKASDATAETCYGDKCHKKCKHPFCKKNRSGNSTRLAGIPFFALEQVERSTAVYEQRYFEMRLEVKRVDPSVPSKDRKAAPTFDTVAIMYTTQEDDARETYADFQMAESINDAIRAVEDTMDPEKRRSTVSPPQPFKPNDIHEENADLRLVSVVRTRVSVPRSDVYFINVDKAAAGTSKGTITLNKEGTLASAEAETADETLATVLQGLPIAAVVSSAFGVPSPTAEEADKQKGVPVYAKFTVVPVAYRYAVTVDSSLPPDSTRVAVPNGRCSFATVTFVVERGDSAPVKTEAQKDGITFSGNVTLPGEKKPGTEK